MNKKIVLITGARGGFGKDVSFALARLGYVVYATTHYEESTRELDVQAQKENLPIKSFKLDITLPEDRKKIEELDIDILINNAAIGESGSIAEIPMDKVRDNFETNLFSTFELSQIALKQMLKKDSGKIIFISSLAGRAPTMKFLSPYVMTKYALSAGVESLRNEIKRLTKNVTISIIEPGAYHTGFNQKNIAKKFVWMNESSYFYNQINKIKRQENFQFKLTEQKSTDSIVKKIVKAVEAKQPRLRYGAPWWQYWGVKLIRIFGK